MGQRLVIQIEENGKPLANAYYHWSGYTGSSIEQTTEVLDNLVTCEEDDYTSLQKAVDALFRTGARFYPDEIMAIEKENIDMGPLQFAFDDGPVDRNSGLLSISASGMESSIKWEEAHVGIDLGTGDIIFDAFYEYTAEDYIQERVDNELEVVDLNEMPVLDIEYQLNMDTWPGFAHDILEILNSGRYDAVSPDHSTVYSFIA